MPAPTASRTSAASNLTERGSPLNCAQPPADHQQWNKSSAIRARRAQPASSTIRLLRFTISALRARPALRPTSTCRSATRARRATLNPNTINVFFYEDSTAGNASITNDGRIYFYNASTAGDAHITGKRPDVFYRFKQRGDATITLGAEIIFDNSRSAGTPTSRSTGARVVRRPHDGGSCHHHHQRPQPRLRGGQHGRQRHDQRPGATSAAPAPPLAAPPSTAAQVSTIFHSSGRCHCQQHRVILSSSPAPLPTPRSPIRQSLFLPRSTGGKPPSPNDTNGNWWFDNAAPRAMRRS